MAPIVWKRALAYLIDILIVSLCLVVVQFFITYQSFSAETNRIISDLVAGDIAPRQYFVQIAEVYQKIDLHNFGLNVINLVLIIIFFIIVPLFKEQTIGQMINGIKIQSAKLTFGQLFIRAIVVNSILISIISLALVYFITPLAYLMLLFFLGLIQFALVIKSVFMILLNEDHRGLQDIWSKTRIVFKEEEDA